MKGLTINTKCKKEVIEITDKLNDLLEEQDKNDGLIFVFVKHTTCCLTTADLDPGTDKDYINALENMLPDLDYNHPHDPSHVGDHISSSIIGPSILLPFSNKKLDLGTWQSAVLIELNGPRKRTFMVRCL